MAKFFSFQKIIQYFYMHVLTKLKVLYSKPTQLGITFASGYLSGVVCTVVLHPADSLVTQLSKLQNEGKSLSAIVGEVGFGTLATKGLRTCVVMIGTLTGVYSHFFVGLSDVSFALVGFQWWVYDSFKASMGMGTTGSK